MTSHDQPCTPAQPSWADDVRVGDVLAFAFPGRGRRPAHERDAGGTVAESLLMTAKEAAKALGAAVTATAVERATEEHGLLVVIGSHSRIARAKP